MNRDSGPADPASDLVPPSVSIPTIGAQQAADDPTVYVRLFTPASSWTWLLIECDPTEELAFGYCCDASYPEGAELGHVSLTELRGLRTRWRLPAVERDLCFANQQLSDALRTECP